MAAIFGYHHMAHISIHWCTLGKNKRRSSYFYSACYWNCLMQNWAAKSTLFFISHWFSPILNFKFGVSFKVIVAFFVLPNRESVLTMWYNVVNFVEGLIRFQCHFGSVWLINVTTPLKPSKCLNYLKIFDKKKQTTLKVCMCYIHSSFNYTCEKGHQQTLSSYQASNKIGTHIHIV